MALDDTTKTRFGEIVDPITSQLSAALSALINDQVSINLSDFTESVTEGGQANVSGPSAMVQAPLAEASLGELVIIVDAANAAKIANSMMGEAEGGEELDDAKLGAFSSAIEQSFAEAKNQVATLQDASLGIQGFNAKILDPGNDESLAVENPSGLEKTCLVFSLQSESGLVANINVDVATELINAVIMIAGDDAAAGGEAGAAAGGGGEPETVGDVLGTDFAEIIDSHDPDEVDEKKNLNLLLDIRMGLIVELGRAEMHLKDILKLTKGSIIELDRLSGEPVDLFVNNKLIARGEVVVIDDNFGLRITQLAGTNFAGAEMGLIGTEDE